MKTPSRVVLIADDDPMLRLSLATRFVQSGFEVVTASDGQTAENIVDHRHVDAAILDVKMPGGDGFRICQRIREAGRAIPIFMMTGADEGVIRNHLGVLTGAAGGTHFVTKPFDAKALVLMVDDALRAG